MADYIKPKDEPIVDDTPSTLKIGEKEYTQEEVESMISRAQQVDELEKKYNTKVDNVWPEYGRSQNRNKELEAELEALKAQASQPKPVGELDEASIAEAREQAKKLGIVTEDVFAEFMNKNFKQLYTQERQAERMIDDGKQFEKEIDGKDGRPKFVLEDILEFMVETGRKDLMGAYKEKYEKELDVWRLEQLKKDKGQPFITQDVNLNPDKQPSPIKPSDENIYKLVEEGLGNY